MVGPPSLLDSRWEVTLNPYKGKTTVNTTKEYSMRKFNQRDKEKIIQAGKKDMLYR